MIKHHPSISDQLMRWSRRSKKRRIPCMPQMGRMLAEHARLAENSVLYDPPENPTPEDILIARDESAMIERALLTLPARVERVVRLYHGFGCQPHTLDQVGEFLGTRRERPRQILAKAYRQLKHPSRPVGRLKGKYTDRWHAPARKAWKTPVIELVKQPWGTPIIVETRPVRTEQPDLDQRLDEMRRLAAQNPQHVAAYAALLTMLLTQQREMRQ